MFLRAALTLILGCLLFAIGAAGPAAAQGGDRRGAPITALEVEGIAPPQVVKGTDGRRHIEYDLMIANVFSGDATLKSVEVLNGRGRRLLRLDGERLAAVTTKMLDTTPTATVEASGAVQTVVDVVLPRGSRVPARLTHRVRYALAPDTLYHQLIGSRRVVGPVLEVERRRQIVVSPPLRGSGWLAYNACCSPSSHRSFVLAANGSLVTPEVFAIDFVQTRGGRLAEGDGSQNSQYFGHGKTVRAAAAGRVVSVVDDLPEVPPGIPVTENQTLRSASDFGGNHVVIRMRRGVYALYGHMITGSVRVKEGDRVRTGQRLGLLGNSGNSSLPHLHFGLIDGPGVLSSDSLPFVFDRFTYGGQAEVSETGDVSITGTPRSVRNAHPLANAIADFSP